MTGLEHLLLSILEDPDDLSLRLILADQLEEEHGPEFADFLRGPGTIIIRSDNGLSVFFSGKVTDRTGSIQGASLSYISIGLRGHCLILLGTLPTKFWPKCICGRLADEWRDGHWRGYGHRCSEEETSSVGHTPTF